MDINRADIRIIGCIWLVISLWLPMSILASGVEETLITSIQAYCALAAMVFGFVSGGGLLFIQRWAAIILRILSWIYALYLFGFTVLIITDSASKMVIGKMVGIIGIPVAIMMFFLGVLFLLMGKYLKKIHACLSKQNIA